MICSGTTYQQKESWLVYHRFRGLQSYTILQNPFQEHQVFEPMDKKTVSEKQTSVLSTTIPDCGSTTFLQWSGFLSG